MRGFREWWRTLFQPRACDACDGPMDGDAGHVCGTCLGAARRSGRGSGGRRRPRASRKDTPARRGSLTTLQGFVVQSEGEVAIADHLFKHGVLFQYEPRVGPYRPDFLVPASRTIIEYYGMKNKSYNERRAKKEAFYKERGYRVIAITRTDLPRIGETLKGLGEAPVGLRAELKRQRDGG